MVLMYNGSGLVCAVYTLHILVAWNTTDGLIGFFNLSSPVHPQLTMATSEISLIALVQNYGMNVYAANNPRKV